MGDANLSAEQKRTLRNAGTKTTKREVSARFRTLYRESEKIPLRAKTQYPTYIEGRTLHLLRGISDMEGVSIQELIREGIELAIDERLRSGKPPSKKRSAKSRSA